jgi:CBS domain-containing protein
MGSVAREVLQQTKMPVLLMRPDTTHASLEEDTTEKNTTARETTPTASVATEASPPVLVSSALRVRDVMTTPVTVVPEDATLSEIAALMREHGIGGVPVVDRQGQLVGIVTESDFTGHIAPIPFTALQAPQLFGEFITSEGIEAIYERARSVTARQAMSSPVITVLEDEPITDAVTRMMDKGMRRLPVVHDGEPVGMLTRHDVLRLMARA